MKRWWVATGWVFLAGLTIVAFTLSAFYLDFSLRSAHQNDEDSIPSFGVVFSGSGERIPFALKLMAQGRIKKLIIVGNTRDNRQKLVDDLVRTNPHIDRSDIVMASESSTTLENGLETWCLLRGDVTPRNKAVTLVTSGYHLPRSSLVLERSLPSGYKVVRLASDAHRKPGEPRYLWSSERIKFFATWVITLLAPKSMWVTGTIQPCD